MINISEQTTEVKPEKKNPLSFSLVIKQPIIKQIFDELSTIVEESTFNIDLEGLTFRGMDPSHVALLDISLSNMSFEKYSINEPGKFAVRVNEIVNCINSFDKKTSITLEYNEYFILSIFDKSLKYELKTIEASSTDCPLPKISYDVKINLDESYLKNVIRHALKFGDYITIEANNTGVLLTQKNDNGSSRNFIENGREELRTLEIKEPSEATYSMEYLAPFFQKLNKDNYTVLEYSSKKPIRITSKINNSGIMAFYLAPRIES